MSAFGVSVARRVFHAYVGVALLVGVVEGWSA